MSGPSPRALAGEERCGEFHGVTGIACNAVAGHVGDHTAWVGARAIRTWARTSVNEQDNEGKERP